MRCRQCMTYYWIAKRIAYLSSLFSLFLHLPALPPDVTFGCQAYRHCSNGNPTVRSDSEVRGIMYYYYPEKILKMHTKINAFPAIWITLCPKSWGDRPRPASTGSPGLHGGWTTSTSLVDVIIGFLLLCTGAFPGITYATNCMIYDHSLTL